MSELKKKLNQLYDLDNIGFAILDSNYSINLINYSFSKLFGYNDKELINQSIQILFKREGLNIIDDIASEVNNSKNKILRKNTINAYHKNKSIISVEFSLSLYHFNNNIIYLLLIRDISTLEKTINDINYITYYDSLTKIPNRRLFFDRFNISIKQANRLNHKLGVLYIDIDEFKSINDTMGHDAGDILLIKFSERLKKCIRDSDTLSRLGGDEFAILMLNIDSKNDISILIERILNRNKLPIKIEDNAVDISFTVGSSIYPKDGEDIKTLLKKADLAMYEDKN